MFFREIHDAVNPEGEKHQRTEKKHIGTIRREICHWYCLVAFDEGLRFQEGQNSESEEAARDDCKRG